MHIGIGINVGGGQKPPSGVDGTEVSRFYFSAAQAADVSPAFDADWAGNTGQRRKLLAAKEAGESHGAANESGDLDSPLAIRQFVSPPLAAQTISGAVRMQMSVRDQSGSGDVTSRLCIRVVSNDGSTVRGTLLSVGDYSAGSFWAGGAVALRNKIFADGDALTEVVAQEGDRLVIEYGADNPSFDIINSRVGAPEGTDDLPEDETETGALVGWIEFTNPLVLQD